MAEPIPCAPGRRYWILAPDNRPLEWMRGEKAALQAFKWWKRHIPGVRLVKTEKGKKA